MSVASHSEVMNKLAMFVLSFQLRQKNNKFALKVLQDAFYATLVSVKRKICHSLFMTANEKMQESTDGRELSEEHFPPFPPYFMSRLLRHLISVPY